jgi:hypothetical protein
LLEDEFKAIVELSHSVSSRTLSDSMDSF